MTDYSNLDYSEGILYFDHKFEVTSDHMEAMHAGSDKDIVIRNTPKLKPTIQHEIDAAMLQSRYSYAMPATIEWVDRYIAMGTYSTETRIVNTGLILYRNPHRARTLTDQVYNACWQLAQPECQIIWAVLSQEYVDSIGRLDWEMVKPVWQECASYETFDHPTFNAPICNQNPANLSSQLAALTDFLKPCLVDLQVGDPLIECDHHLFDTRSGLQFLHKPLGTRALSICSACGRPARSAR